jgi:hypothetical protein
VTSTPTGPRFTPREPGGDVAAFVSARFQGSDASDDWPCWGEVILDLPASAVSRYGRRAIVEPIGPDRCRLVLGSWSWPALAAAIGQFDTGFQVVGPVEPRDTCALLARRYADAVRPSVPSIPPSTEDPASGAPPTGD